MESSLHQQLKKLYAAQDHAREVTISGYRIDAISRSTLIEVQQASLSAIRHKVGALLALDHRVLVVKPLVAHKRLVYLDAQGGQVLSQRSSPRKEGPLHIFDELVHFTKLFPHPRLTVEVLLIDQVEYRVRRTTKRRRQLPYKVIDREVISVNQKFRLKTPRDLIGLIPGPLPLEFTTADLATATGLPKYLAQKIAYTLRHCGAATLIGKSGRSCLYRLAVKQKPASRAA
jgi:hypothetical protein